MASQFIVAVIFGCIIIPNLKKNNEMFQSGNNYFHSNNATESKLNKANSICFRNMFYLTIYHFIMGNSGIIFYILIQKTQLFPVDVPYGYYASPTAIFLYQHIHLLHTLTPNGHPFITEFGVIKDFNLIAIDTYNKCACTLK